MEGGFTPYLTLESKEYQTYMLNFASNVIHKLCDLLGGGGKNGIFYNFIDPFPQAEDAKSSGITINNHMVDFSLI